MAAGTMARLALLLPGASLALLKSHQQSPAADLRPEVPLAPDIPREALLLAQLLTQPSEGSVGRTVEIRTQDGHVELSITPDDLDNLNHLGYGAEQPSSSSSALSAFARFLQHAIAQPVPSWILDPSDDPAPGAAGNGTGQKTGPPSGSDIWNKNISWSTIRRSHPAGMITHINGGYAMWNDVSYISLNVMLVLSLICYPAMLIMIFLAMTILISSCLVVRPDPAQTASPPRMASEAGSDLVQIAPPESCLPFNHLNERSMRLYVMWVGFCRSIPSMFVFGLPLILMALSRPYPQEVFAVLTLVPVVMMFSNGVYMVIYGGSSILRLRRLMATSFCDADSGAVTDGEASESQGDSPTMAQLQEVHHWIMLPQYKESSEVVAMTLESIAASPLAASSIYVLLAMEAREQGAFEKAMSLKHQFAGRLKEVEISLHPPDLPNDPPGKASNVSWGFRHILTKLQREQEAAGAPALPSVVLTVADADSEFHCNYFGALARLYLEAGKNKDMRIWQSPVFHLKNYHRQPMPVVVGTMFTCMQELAGLSDPHAMRFPYSTYSLSLDLARRVGGWDPEWIAEDWHMGIKCFLMTLGQCSVEPLLLPTANYTPEEDNYWGTIDARWAQAKRHALGFSDMAYYFMMLPLLYAKACSNTSTLTQFWVMAANGIFVVVKLVNVHVIIGLLTTYTVLGASLKFIMGMLLSTSRHFNLLERHTHFCVCLISTSSVICTLIITCLFLATYELLKDRIEDKPWTWRSLHMARSVLSFAIFGPFYFLGLGFAVWRAAFQLLLRRTFVYEVASKPVPKAK